MADEEPVLATELSLSHVAASTDGWLTLYRDRSAKLGARLLSKDGTPRAAVDIEATPEATAHGVAFDGEAYVVVWTEGPHAAHYLKYRRLSATGDLLGPAVTLRAGGSEQDSRVAVASSDEGAMVVTCDSGGHAGCEPFVVQSVATSGGFTALAAPPANLRVAYSEGSWLVALGSFDAPKTSLWPIGQDGAFVGPAPVALGSGGQEAFPSVVPHAGGFLVGWNAGTQGYRGALVDKAGSISLLPNPIATWPGESHIPRQLLSSPGGLALFTPDYGAYWLNGELEIGEDFAGLAGGMVAAMDATSLVSLSGPHVHRVGIGSTAVTYGIPVLTRLPHQFLQGVAAGPRGYLVSYVSEGALYVSPRAEDSTPVAPPSLVPGPGYAPDLLGVVGIDTGWLFALQKGGRYVTQRLTLDGSLQEAVFITPLVTSFHASLAPRGHGALLVHDEIVGKSARLVVTLLDGAGVPITSRVAATFEANQLAGAKALKVFASAAGHELVWSTREQGVWSVSLDDDGVPLSDPKRLLDGGSGAEELGGEASTSGRWLWWQGLDGFRVLAPSGPAQQLEGSGSLSVALGVGVVARATPPAVHVGLLSPSGTLSEVDVFEGVSSFVGSSSRSRLSEPRGHAMLCAFPQIKRALGVDSARVALRVLEVN